MSSPGVGVYLCWTRLDPTLTSFPPGSHVVRSSPSEGPDLFTNVNTGEPGPGPLVSKDGEGEKTDEVVSQPRSPSF